MKTRCLVYKPINRGFTLIELLIVIGILAILATVTLLVLNPAQMFKQARDSNRLSDIQTINKAVLVYQSSGGSSVSLGTSGTIYVSLPSNNSDCSGLGLPTPPTGYTYACKPTSTYRNTDGTGWIPVNFQSVSYGSPLGTTLPIDPTNTVSGGLYYTYMAGSWALSATMESDQYLASATSDGGYSYARVEVGSDLSLNQHIPNCGGQPITDVDGNSYSTIQIGNQCWFAENLNVGTMINISSAQTNNGTIEKYCYSNSAANCDTDGGLYQWDEAMQYSTTAGVKGICPTDWHIPTDAEWKTLIEGQATAGCDSGQGWNCSPAASHLSIYTLGGDNSSGFSGILAGYSHNDGVTYMGRGEYGSFWSSTESSPEHAWPRNLNSNNSGVYRYPYYLKVFGYSIRCLKN